MSALRPTSRPQPDLPLAPASTVACLRTGQAGLEVLLVQRNARLAFHGGAWVFPGGRVEAADAPDGKPFGPAAGRTAAVREAAEEASLSLDPDALVPLSHWTTPPGRPRRFVTWFFLTELLGPPEAVAVDGAEISAHRWLGPGEALAAQARGEIRLPPPTFVTLTWLARFADVAEVLETAAQREPELFVPRHCRSGQLPVSLYLGDAGYVDLAPDKPGRRHRLWMGDGPWRYERS